MTRLLLSASSLAALTAILASPAAAITCKGNFQVLADGNEIATPYCEDAMLATVARQSGMRVTASRIRENPSVKGDACKFAGDDNRVRDTCAPYGGGGDLFTCGPGGN